MTGEVYLSTAYLPPAYYFSLINRADKVLIEHEENYIKQTYRNRCYILSADGPHSLSVPVYQGSLHKTHIKDIRIDYSKRWQQVHLRAITAAYSASPYYDFYFDRIESIISGNSEFLIDLNMKLTEIILEILKIWKPIMYTTRFNTVGFSENDFRYNITPKNKPEVSSKKYIQVFNQGEGFIDGLSILDLIFNVGPDALSYITK
jgi:hypothetical protein